MSAFEYDMLMAPIDGAFPCGVELRGDPEFRDIEDAPGDFAQNGAPELRQVVQRCDAFLTRTKDHMPAIVGLQAAVRLGDLDLANDALRVVKGFADLYWEDFHPGPADEMATARINELTSLARPAAMVLPLQRAPLAAMPAPSLTGFTAGMIALACAPVAEWSSDDEAALAAKVENGQTSVVAARGIRPNQEGARQLRLFMRSLSPDARQADLVAEVGGDTGDMSTEAVEAVARQLRAQVAAAHDALSAMSDLLYDINAVYDRHVGDSASLGPVHAALRTIIAELATFLTVFPGNVESADGGMSGAVAGDAPAGDTGGTPRPAQGFVSSVPRNRSDVLAALDAIGRYYSDQEPSSPVPLMLRRVQTWVNLDFIGLINEISPQSLDDVQTLLAIRSDEE